MRRNRIGRLTVLLAFALMGAPDAAFPAGDAALVSAAATVASHCGTSWGPIGPSSAPVSPIGDCCGEECDRVCADGCTGVAVVLAGTGRLIWPTSAENDAGLRALLRNTHGLRGHFRPPRA